MNGIFIVISSKKPGAATLCSWCSGAAVRLCSFATFASSHLDRAEAKYLIAKEKPEFVL